MQNAIDAAQYRLLAAYWRSASRRAVNDATRDGFLELAECYDRLAMLFGGRHLHTCNLTPSLH